MSVECILKQSEKQYIYLSYYIKYVLTYMISILNIK